MRIRLELEKAQVHNKAQLVVSRLHGHEAISELFWFDLQIACTDPSQNWLDPKDVVNAGATLVFERDDGTEQRRVHGIIATMKEELFADEYVRDYSLRLVPRAWRLQQRWGQNVYVDTSIKEIIKAKLEDAGLSAAKGDFDLKGFGSVKKGETPQGASLLGSTDRQLTVQYRENDLAFISRLAEHVGIGFYFEHQQGRDKLVFTDSTFDTLKTNKVELDPKVKRKVFQLAQTHVVIPDEYAVADYDHDHPDVKVSSQYTGTETVPLASSTRCGSHIEYGAHFSDPNTAGKRLSEVRAQERLCQENIYSGSSGCYELESGRKTELTPPPQSGFSPRDLELLVVEVEHQAKLSALGSTEGGSYRNSFCAIEAQCLYRPPRTTPRSRIYGIVTGVVQSAAATEPTSSSASDESLPDIDDQGRYLIRFHFDPGFDPTAPAATATSHRIRMAQPAGTQQGLHFPLRPNTEVLLAFVNGDPDRPIIVGAVHNATHPSPVTSKNKTQNVITTFSNVTVVVDDAVT